MKGYINHYICIKIESFSIKYRMRNAKKAQIANMVIIRLFNEVQ